MEVADGSFYDNGASGLSITTSGDVTLDNLTASDNGQDGVDVTGVCTNSVSVNGGAFADNDKYGLKVTNATLTLDGTQTFSNNPSGNVFQNSSGCASNNDRGNHNGNGHGNGSGSGHGSGHGCPSWYYKYKRCH